MRPCNDGSLAVASHQTSPPPSSGCRKAATPRRGARISPTIFQSASRSGSSVSPRFSPSVPAHRYHMLRLCTPGSRRRAAAANDTSHPIQKPKSQCTVPRRPCKHPRCYARACVSCTNQPSFHILSEPNMGSPRRAAASVGRLSPRLLLQPKELSKAARRPPQERCPVISR